LQANEALLRELAERTGGRLLAPGQAGATYDLSGLPRAEARRAIWEPLIKWVILLFLLDVAVRRIAVRPREVLERVRRYVAELAGRRPAAQPEAVLTTLKDTRERLRERMAEPPGEAGPAPQAPAGYEPPVPDAKVTEELSKALDGASEMERPVVARPTRKAGPKDEADFTSRLLKAKRRAQERLRKEQNEQDRKA